MRSNAKPNRSWGNKTLSLWPGLEESTYALEKEKTSTARFLLLFYWQRKRVDCHSFDSETAGIKAIYQEVPDMPSSLLYIPLWILGLYV